MLNKIMINTMTNISQLTDWFDVSKSHIAATTVSNIIKNTGLNGLYTLSPDGELASEFMDDTNEKYVSGSISTSPCVCNTFEFINGEVATDCYFGDVEVIHSLFAHKPNIGTAMTRELALEHIMKKDNGNVIMIYMGSTENADRSDQWGTGRAQDHWVRYEIGVFVKLDSNHMKEIGCTDADKFFVSSILGVKTESSTHLKFEKVLSRFFVGDHSVMEYQFSYEDFMLLYDIMKDRVKGFNNPDLHIITVKE